MALFNIKSSFLKTPRHQRFSFVPLYYDADKEELEKRVKLAESEMTAEKSTEALREMKIKTSFRRAREKSLSLNKEQEIKKSRIRFVFILAILVAAAAWIIFTV